MKTNPITKQLEEILYKYASRFTDKSYILHQDNFSGVIVDIKQLQQDLLNTIESEVCGIVDIRERFNALQLLKDKIKKG